MAWEPGLDSKFVYTRQYHYVGVKDKLNFGHEIPFYWRQKYFRRLSFIQFFENMSKITVRGQAMSENCG